MSEIEKLIAEKKEIEKKIKELKDGRIKKGGAIFVRESFPTDRPDDYKIMVEVIYDRAKEWEFVNKRRNTAVIVANTREDAIKHIPKIIKDLEGLKEDLEKK